MLFPNNFTFNFNVSGARVSKSWADAVAKSGNVGLTSQGFSTVSFRIYQNSSSKTLNLNYSLTDNTNISLVLYSINGQEVNTLINNVNHSSGSYSEIYDASGLKTGIYLARFTAGGVNKSCKILIN